MYIYIKLTSYFTHLNSWVLYVTRVVFRPAGWIQRLVSRASAEFVFHSWTTQQHQILLLQVRGGQPGAADRDRKWHVTSAAEVTWSCSHHLTPSALITTNSLHVFICVFFVCQHFFTRDICFSCFMFVSCFGLYLYLYLYLYQYRYRYHSCEPWHHVLRGSVELVWIVRVSEEDQGLQRPTRSFELLWWASERSRFSSEDEPLSAAGAQQNQPDP